jgi:hypothetical protein
MGVGREESAGIPPVRRGKWQRSGRIEELLSNHSHIIRNDDQQDATVLDLFISSLLYMFRAIPSPIIRST